MRARDVVKFTKICVPQFFGVVAVEDGEDIGHCAIIWGDKGRPYMCLEITEKLRQKPVFMVKVAKDVINAAIQSGELFALEDKEEPTSQRLLAFLGFRDTGEVMNGERVLRHGG